MNIDAAGIVHDDGKALKQIHSVANAPIFAHSDGFFGDGIVGGPMHSAIEGSRLTASVAVRILGGERASDIKVLDKRFLGSNHIRPHRRACRTMCGRQDGGLHP